MLCDHNPGLESINFIDGLIFTRNDPCLWVVYPGGAAGDLLISILNRHYLRTGCEYYGINDRGRVMLYTSDFRMIDLAVNNNQPIEFNDQWFYDFSDQLGKRNLVYSMLDQVIFGCQLYSAQNLKKILDSFTKAQIINIYPQDGVGDLLIRNLRKFKLEFEDPDPVCVPSQPDQHRLDLIDHPRVLNVPFGFLFDRKSYDKYYAKIRNFLGLPGPLICFEYVEFYLSKQNRVVEQQLRAYSQNL